MSTEKTNIWDVLLAFQLDPPSLVKDTSGQVGPRKYKYMTLDQVVERVVRDRLNKAGCVVLQPLAVTDIGTALVTIIRHVESGTEVRSETLLPEAATPQDMGKSTTYMRRYSLVSTLSLIGDEDDDGDGFQPRLRTATAPEGFTAPAGTPLPPAATGGSMEL